MNATAPAEAHKTASAAEGTPTKPPKDTKNDVTRPKAGTATGRVWAISDDQSAKAGEPAKRKDVIAAFVGEGGNPSTAATQYGRWRRYNGLGRDAKAATAEAAVE